MFTFVSGNLGLDFAGTVSSRVLAPRDLLTEPARLGAWIAAADLLDAAPLVDQATLAAAVRLREAIYRLARDTGAAADRDLLNAAARGLLPRLTLTATAGLIRDGDAAAALAAVARASVELLGGPDRQLIKECGRPDCTRLYLDTSRGGGRRWCDMTVCGNRAKSAAFRSRNQ